MLTNKKTAFLLFFSLALLTSCQNQVRVNDVITNKVDYLSEKFTPQALKPEIYNQIKTGNASLKFNEVNIKYIATSENNKNEKEIDINDVNYKNVGNGLIQETLKYSKNDIPYLSNYVLSYIGIIGLRMNGMRHDQITAGDLLEVKEISLFDSNISHPQENTHYNLEFSRGKEPQIFLYNPRKLECTTGTFYKASKLNAKLLGDAIDMDCNDYNNGIYIGKTKQTFLQEYGFFVFKEHKDAGNKIEYSIENIEAF